MVAPVTSTVRGVPSEVVLNEEDGMKSPCAVKLYNAVTVSQQRLGRRVAQLSAARPRVSPVKHHSNLFALRHRNTVESHRVFSDGDRDSTNQEL